MKLATLDDGSRDGQLVVVSRDLASAHHASAVATRMQQLLDDWNFLSPQLEDLYAALNAGRARHAFAFDPRRCRAPLPRAFCRAGAPGHRPPASVGDDAGTEAMDAAATPPELRLAPGDALLGPCEDIVLVPGEAAIDCAAGLAVISGDIAAGATPTQALEGVRLLALVGDWMLPELVASAFAPLAVTPDELGPAWRDGRVHLPLQMRCRGATGEAVDADAAMTHDFGALLAELARRRGLRAGSLVGSGPLIHAATAAAACGPALRRGDRVRIEMTAPGGGSVFGAIEQEVAAAVPAAADTGTN
ncbi:MAG: hypothetical protein ABS84_03830 [Rubrivivax sp. SCN 71-131]|nr:MAG: hypothetical protein ABS84_03830 [Rubrivivax sp. SCN 71-131]